MSTAELVCVLHAIMAEPEIEARDSLNWGDINDRHPLIQEAAELAENLLIDENGERNVNAEIALRLAGFDVFCLEQDRHGWLIGAIETDKGLITYG